MFSGSISIDPASFLDSIAGRIDGCLYRCRNDSDYTMLYLSAGFETLTGHAAADFLGAGGGFASLIHPDDGAHVDAAVAEALERQGRWQVYYRMKTRTGDWRHVYETGGGCADPATGETAFLDGIILDFGRMNELAERLDRGRLAVDEIDGAVAEIVRTLKTLRLLALNARIEAARAREHGAGFGVVAQEMVGLADAGDKVTKTIAAELGRLGDIIRV